MGNTDSCASELPRNVAYRSQLGLQFITNKNYAYVSYRLLCIFGMEFLDILSFGHIPAACKSLSEKVYKTKNKQV